VSRAIPTSSPETPFARQLLLGSAFGGPEMLNRSMVLSNVSVPEAGRKLAKLVGGSRRDRRLVHLLGVQGPYDGRHVGIVLYRLAEPFTAADVAVAEMIMSRLDDMHHWSVAAGLCPQIETPAYLGAARRAAEAAAEATAAAAAAAFSASAAKLTHVPRHGSPAAAVPMGHSQSGTVLSSLALTDGSESTSEGSIAGSSVNPGGNAHRGRPTPGSIANDSSEDVASICALSMVTPSNGTLTPLTARASSGATPLTARAASGDRRAAAVRDSSSGAAAAGAGTRSSSVPAQAAPRISISPAADAAAVAAAAAAAATAAAVAAGHPPVATITGDQTPSKDSTSSADSSAGSHDAEPKFQTDMSVLGTIMLAEAAHNQRRQAAAAAAAAAAAVAASGGAEAGAVGLADAAEAAGAADAAGATGSAGAAGAAGAAAAAASGGAESRSAGATGAAGAADAPRLAMSDARSGEAVPIPPVAPTGKPPALRQGSTTRTPLPVIDNHLAPDPADLGCGSSGETSGATTTADATAAVATPGGRDAAESAGGSVDSGPIVDLSGISDQERDRLREAARVWDPNATPFPTDEAHRVAELTSYGILDTDEDVAFDRITRTCQRLFGVPTALVSLVDSDRQWFLSHTGLDARETPRCMAFCAWAITEPHGGVFEVRDAHQDPRFAGNPLVVGPPHVRFYAGAPIITPNNRALGTLCLIDNTAPRAEGLTEDQRESLISLSEVVMQMIMIAGRNRAMRSLINTSSVAVGSLERQRALYLRALDSIDEAIIILATTHEPAGTTVAASSVAGSAGGGSTIEADASGRAGGRNGRGNNKNNSGSNKNNGTKNNDDDGEDDDDQSVDDAMDTVLIVHCNEGFTRTTGCHREAAIGCSLNLLFGADIEATFAARREISLVLSRGEPGRVRVQLDRSDGTRFWCNISLTPVRWGDARNQRQRPGFSDATGPGGPTEGGSQQGGIHRPTAGTTAAGSTTGASAGGASVPEPLATAEAAAAAAVAATMSSSTPEYASVEPSSELGALGGDGAIDQDNSGFWAAVIYDVSDDMDHARSLEEAREQAESEVRSKDIFLRTVSHELRTPLNSLYTAVKMLPEIEPLSEEQLDLVQLMEGGAEALKSLICNLLDYASIGAGKIVVHSSPVRVWDLVDAAMTIVSPLARAKGLSAASTVAADVPPVVEADLKLIRQVLTNILGNSVKFTDTGGIRVNVCAVSTSQRGGTTRSTLDNMSDMRDLVSISRTESVSRGRAPDESDNTHTGPESLVSDGGALPAAATSAASLGAAHSQPAGRGQGHSHSQGQGHSHSQHQRQDQPRHDHGHGPDQAQEQPTGPDDSTSTTGSSHSKWSWPSATSAPRPHRRTHAAGSSSINSSGGSTGVELLFECFDTGRGIPSELVPTVFDPFVRAEDSHAVEGTGLGLAIAKSIVGSMGGVIGVESMVGEGTRMWFQVPLSKAPVAAVSAFMSAGTAGVAGRSMAGLTAVLVCERESTADALGALDRCKSLLHAVPLAVCSVATPREAADVAARIISSGSDGIVVKAARSNDGAAVLAVKGMRWFLADFQADDQRADAADAAANTAGHPDDVGGSMSGTSGSDSINSPLLRISENCTLATLVNTIAKALAGSDDARSVTLPSPLSQRKIAQQQAHRVPAPVPSLATLLSQGGGAGGPSGGSSGGSRPRGLPPISPVVTRRLAEKSAQHQQQHQHHHHHQQQQPTLGARRTSSLRSRHPDSPEELVPDGAHPPATNSPAASSSLGVKPARAVRGHRSEVISGPSSGSASGGHGDGDGGRHAHDGGNRQARPVRDAPELLQPPPPSASRPPVSSPSNALGGAANDKFAKKSGTHSSSIVSEQLIPLIPPRTASATHHFAGHGPVQASATFGGAGGGAGDATVTNVGAGVHGGRSLSSEPDSADFPMVPATATTPAASRRADRLRSSGAATLTSPNGTVRSNSGGSSNLENSDEQRSAGRASVQPSQGMSSAATQGRHSLPDARADAAAKITDINRIAGTRTTDDLPAATAGDIMRSGSSVSAFTAYGSVGAQSVGAIGLGGSRGRDRLRAAHHTSVSFQDPPRLSPSGSTIPTLIVDDIASNNLVMRMVLKRMGHLNPKIATNGEEALAIYTASLGTDAPIRVVLMDLRMPVMDGFAAASAMRKAWARAPRTPRPTLIAITADAVDNIRSLCLVHGFDGWLNKPLDRDMLKLIMDACIAGARLPAGCSF
jgi:signal transduction histidine kinase/CheY-like chemotaxis protein